MGNRNVSTLSIHLSLFNRFAHSAGPGILGQGPLPRDVQKCGLGFWSSWRSFGGCRRPEIESRSAPGAALGALGGLVEILKQLGRLQERVAPNFPALKPVLRALLDRPRADLYSFFSAPEASKSRFQRSWAPKSRPNGGQDAPKWGSRGDRSYIWRNLEICRQHGGF